MNITKELMIKAIYEKIADKTLSFGCKYNHTSEMYFIWFITPWIAEFDRAYWVKLSKTDIKRNTIWHPVMIWDVLDYIDSIEFNHPNDFIKWHKEKYPIIIDVLFNDWENKRKPIEEQSEKCIEWIYNLIK